MSSLLNKTLSRFLICTLVILLLATPAFYLLTKHFYAEDMIDLIEAMERGEKEVPHLDLEEDILQGVMIQFFLVFTILSCSLLITIRVITRRLWHPFDDTLRKMEQFNLEQNDDPHFLPTKIKEFDRLNKSAELLIHRNRLSYQTQKEFTENASHELQTPLAIAQSKLDLLLQEELDESQSKIVNDLYKAYTRMSRLNKNLLLLARIENAQFCDKTRINVTQFVESQISLFEELHENKTLIVLENKESGSFFIKANEILLESLVNNLFVNALRHSWNGCCVEVELKEKSISVRNKAEGGPLDEKTLFRRFQFTDNRRRGNGLGLSIVKAICDFHGWKLTYRFENGSHLFSVNFN